MNLSEDLAQGSSVVLSRWHAFASCLGAPFVGAAAAAGRRLRRDVQAQRLDQAGRPFRAMLQQAWQQARRVPATCQIVFDALAVMLKLPHL